MNTPNLPATPDKQGPIFEQPIKFKHIIAAAVFSASALLASRATDSPKFRKVVGDVGSIAAVSTACIAHLLYIMPIFIKETNNGIKNSDSVSDDDQI